MAVAYALVFALCGIWLTAKAALPSGQIWSLLILVIAGSVIAATVAMFFSTFLNPYVATAMTVVLFCAPGMFHVQRHAWSLWLPGCPSWRTSCASASAPIGSSTGLRRSSRFCKLCCSGFSRQRCSTVETLRFRWSRVSRIRSSNPDASVRPGFRSKYP